MTTPNNKGDGFEETQDSLFEGRADVTSINPSQEFSIGAKTSKSIVMNRKDLFRKYRDHLRDGNTHEKVLKDRMDKYFSSTYKSKNFRVTTMDNASKEIEKQATRVARMKVELETVSAFRSENILKVNFMNSFVHKYPEMI